ncbi:MAG: acetolactate synthase [Acidocella sp. 20-61-6]|nr:MAG: acetolactate synthase [Acidocella sp. 20-61-6]
MNERSRGADMVVDTLRKAGVRTIFALSGNHIMPIFDATIGAGIDLIHVRHEAAAVHMADAYARITGHVGVALVTGGPGHANAMGALCTALDGESPVLLLSGHAPHSEQGLGAFQEFRQAEIAAPLTKASWTSQSVSTLSDDIMHGLRIACSARPGPVNVSIPIDMLLARWQQENVTTDFDPKVQYLAAETAQAVITILRQGKRPLVVAPPALCTIRGRAALERLRLMGLPVIAMESPRGIYDPSLGDIASLLAKVDVLVLLGKALDFTLKFGATMAFAEDCRWVVLEPDAIILDRVTRLLGDRLALKAIADPFAAIVALQQVADAGFEHARAWNDHVEYALARRDMPPACDAEQALNSATMCMVIGNFLHAREDVIFVSDGGEIGQWAQALIATETRIINGMAGAIGPAIPFAIGAKAAAPSRPVLAVMGDGAFGFHMAEFDTAVRHGLPFVAVVGNDARWNAEYQIQLRDYGPERTVSCDLLPATRYDAVVAAMGGYGELVTSLADLDAALTRAFASGKPACLNVLIEGLAAPNFKPSG